MTKEEELNKLVDPNQTQVFVCTSPSNMPISFGAHSWFVINRKGKLSRWEVLFRRIKGETHWGHLAKNHFRPFAGIEVFPYTKAMLWSAKCHGVVSGTAAQQLADVIERSPTEYPFYYKYFLLGPNSNTYVQSRLDIVQGISIKLPFNCFGKDHV